MVKRFRKDDSVVNLYKAKPKHIEDTIRKILAETGFKEEEVNFEGNE
jgi:hypothetical protein